jgi:excisionase family DNA binding protein
MSGELLVSLDEAARRLAVSRRLVQLLIQQGELASVKVGRCRRLEVAVLERYVQQLRDDSARPLAVIGEDALITQIGEFAKLIRHMSIVAVTCVRWRMRLTTRKTCCWPRRRRGIARLGCPTRSMSISMNSSPEPAAQVLACAPAVRSSWPLCY